MSDRLRGRQPAEAGVAGRISRTPLILSACTALALICGAGAAAADCGRGLVADLLPDAMIGATLNGCPGEEVAIHHGPLVFTVVLDDAGALTLEIPALAPLGLRADFAGEVMMHPPAPDLAQPRPIQPDRLAVLWQGPGNFRMEMAPGTEATALGSDKARWPMRALVADRAALRSLRVAVTPELCGRELLAETIRMSGGQILVDDLTVAMPACDSGAAMVDLGIPGG